MVISQSRKGKNYFLCKVSMVLQKESILFKNAKSVNRSSIHVREIVGAKFNFTRNSRDLPYRQYSKCPADVANITLP